MAEPAPITLPPPIALSSVNLEGLGSRLLIIIFIVSESLQRTSSPAGGRIVLVQCRAVETLTALCFCIEPQPTARLLSIAENPL